MTLTYGPRGEPLFSDGRPMWYGLKGEPLTSKEANTLLRDRRRKVAQTLIRNGRERVSVSTIFLVVDYGMAIPGGPRVPVLWETMVFGGPLDGYQDRYASRRVAKAGHAVTVIAVRIAIGVKQAARARRRRMHAAYRARWA